MGRSEAKGAAEGAVRGGGARPLGAPLSSGGGAEGC